MAEMFKKYFVVGIVCTIMCKGLFPYPPLDFTQQESSTCNSSLIVVDDADSVIFGDDEKESINYRYYLSIWENAETDEDETPEVGIQKESLHLTFYTTEISYSFVARRCNVTIPLFVLFHSWKCFLI